MKMRHEKSKNWKIREIFYLLIFLFLLRIGIQHFVPPNFIQAAFGSKNWEKRLKFCMQPLRIWGYWPSPKSRVCRNTENEFLQRQCSDQPKIFTRVQIFKTFYMPQMHPKYCNLSSTTIHPIHCRSLPLSSTAN